MLVVAGVVVCFLGRQIAVFGLDNDTSTLATLVSVVAIRSIRHAKDALRTLQRPKSAINVLNLNGRNNLVNFFHISDSRTSGGSGTTRKLVAKVNLSSTLQPIELSKN